MLIKVTTRCQMGCSHCMEDCKSEGEDMSAETFGKALAFADELESACPISLTMIGGGEPTLHPDILDILDIALAQGNPVMLLSNGLFLDDEELREEIIGRQALLQITNDSRFYPRKPRWLEDHPAFEYVDSITMLTPMGRFKGKTHPEVPSKKAPNCFNLRSLTGHFRDARIALGHLRARVMSGGFSGFCTPSISVDGTVCAGETRFCHPIGTVDSDWREITDALRDMRCSECGLVLNLTQEQKRAIGESTLFLASER